MGVVLGRGPSGAAGPVAVSLAAFRRYHESDSWTWERMALTRARLVAVTGETGVRSRMKKALLTALNDALTPRPQENAATLLADAAAMRARLARDLPPPRPWDIKRRAGGRMEVGFISPTPSLIHL